MGLDPAKNGGDLLWVSVVPAPDGPSGSPCSFQLALGELALGPTGDIAPGFSCKGSLYSFSYIGYQRFNGSGALSLSGRYFTLHQGALNYLDWDAFTLTPGNDLALGVWGTAACGGSAEAPIWGIDQQVAPGGPWIHTGVKCGGDSCQGGGSPYCKVGITHALSSTGQLVPSPPPFGTPDGMGGVYFTGTLSSTKDVGCGPMVPGPSASAYVTHLDASSACIYSHVLPAEPTLVADPGGAVLVVSSIESLDLGCGALPAAPGGSTFVTRLDPSGICVFGKSLQAPGLTAALDPSGRVVLSALVGAVPVDLGGGPLAPLGSEDIVLGELDTSGNHLWSKRFGGPGITFAGPHVTLSAAGDVYLRTGWSGSADLGGGPITAASHDTVVGSYSPAGAHRWSRGFPITGNYLAGVDGCGALVVASTDAAFDLGQGKVLPPFDFSSPRPSAIARHAP